MTRRTKYKYPSSQALITSLSSKNKALASISTEQAWTMYLDHFHKKFSSSKERGLGLMTQEIKDSGMLVLSGEPRANKQVACFVPTQGMQITGLLVRILDWSIKEIFGQAFEASQRDLRKLVKLWQVLYGALTNTQAQGLTKKILIKDDKGNLRFLSTRIIFNQEGLWEVSITNTYGNLDSKEIILEMNNEIAYPFAWLVGARE